MKRTIVDWTIMARTPPTVFSQGIGYGPGADGFGSGAVRPANPRSPAHYGTRRPKASRAGRRRARRRRSAVRTLWCWWTTGRVRSRGRGRSAFPGARAANSNVAATPVYRRRADIARHLESESGRLAEDRDD